MHITGQAAYTKINNSKMLRLVRTALGDALEPVDREEVWDQVLNEPVHMRAVCYARSGAKGS